MKSISSHSRPAGRLSLLTLSISTALALTGTGFVNAQDNAPVTRELKQYDIQPGPLGPALNAFAQQSNIALSFNANLVAGLVSPGLQGRYGVEEGLAQLLQGSGLMVRTTGAGYVLEKSSQGAAILPAVNVSADAMSGQFGDAPSEAHGFKADYQTTATKMPMALKDTPQSISVITRESIDARHATDVLSALELAAGVTAGVSSGGGPFAGPSPRVAEQFSLRGQRLDGDRDVRIDGFAAGGMRNEFDLAAFERVEVIKGPSSMMYGQGSVGGFINLVQKKPQEEFAAKLNATVGSYDTYRGELDVTGALTDNKTVLGRIAVAYDDRGSFIDHVESQRTVIAPSVDFYLGENTRLLLTALHQDTDSVPSLGIPVLIEGDEIKLPPKLDESYYFGVPAVKESETTESMISARLDHQLNDDWLGTLLLQQGKNDRHGYADNYGYGIYTPEGDTYVSAASTLHETDTWAGELRLSGAFNAFNRKHQVMMGLEINERQQDSSGGWASVGTANLYEENFADAGFVRADELPIMYSVADISKSRAAYLQFNFELTDRVKLLAGTRYDKAEQIFRDLLDPTGGSEDDSSATTFRLGLTGKITEQLNGYASYGQSFTPVLAVSEDRKILDPKRGEGFEIGLKGEWFDGALAASTALFRQELDDRPIPAGPPNDPGFDYSISAGLQRTDGLEIELSGSPTDGLTIGAALTFLDAEYIDKKDPNYGLTPSETTDQQSAVYASYEFQQGLLQKLELGATWVNVGDRWSISSRVYPNQGSPDPERNLTAEGYDRVDLNARYPLTREIELSMQVRNVTDERYLERNNGAYGYGHYFGSPRAWLFNVEYTLN